MSLLGILKEIVKSKNGTLKRNKMKSLKAKKSQDEGWKGFGDGLADEQTNRYLWL